MKTSAGSGFVMVVEPDMREQTHLTQALKQAFPRLQQHVFNNSIELILQLQRTLTSLPKFILLDLYSPLLCGRKALAWIRANKNYREVPVIMLAQGAQEGELNACYLSGANSCLLVPPDPVLFTAMITSLHRFL